jgi:hypothetical protein
LIVKAALVLIDNRAADPTLAAGFTDVVQPFGELQNAQPLAYEFGRRIGVHLAFSLN